MGIEKDARVFEDLKVKAMNSRQLKKCVDYIMNVRFASCTDKVNIAERIRSEYLMFIENFYHLLYQNREIVLGQFRN